MNKKKKWMINIAAWGLIVAGMLVALFPLIDSLRMEHYRRKLLKAYEEQFVLEEQVNENAHSFLENLTEGVIEHPITEAPADDTLLPPDMTTDERGQRHTEPTTVPTTQPEVAAPAIPAPQLDVIGKIQIPKISVELPILATSTEYNMMHGAVHVDGTTMVGEIGNCGIAAHRGRASWYGFNRLNEIVQGDVIYVYYQGKKYEYTVYDTLVVEPDQTEVLNRSKTEKVLTLITCDPIGSDRYRLIVHALQKPE